MKYFFCTLALVGGLFFSNQKGFADVRRSVDEFIMEYEEFRPPPRPQPPSEVQQCRQRFLSMWNSGEMCRRLYEHEFSCGSGPNFDEWSYSHCAYRYQGSCFADVYCQPGNIGNPDGSQFGTTNCRRFLSYSSLPTIAGPNLLNICEE